MVLASPVLTPKLKLDYNRQTGIHTLLVVTIVITFNEKSYEGPHCITLHLRLYWRYRDDVWAFGISLIEIFDMGRVPYAGKVPCLPPT